MRKMRRTRRIISRRKKVETHNAEAVYMSETSIRYCGDRVRHSGNKMSINK